MHLVPWTVQVISSVEVRRLAAILKLTAMLTAPFHMSEGDAIMLFWCNCYFKCLQVVPFCCSVAIASYFGLKVL